MIWDVLSPLYDFFETIYNGKCFKGIAEEIKNHVGKDDVVLECTCGTGLLTLPMAQICKEIVEGRMPCAFAIISPLTP